MAEELAGIKFKPETCEKSKHIYEKVNRNMIIEILKPGKSWFKITSELYKKTRHFFTINRKLNSKKFYE